jgi:hypothetical protein
MRTLTLSSRPAAATTDVVAAAGSSITEVVVDSVNVRVLL